MKVLITGAAGLLGSHLGKNLQKHNIVFPYTRSELDITDKEQIQTIFCTIVPDVVVNCAAMANVDKCELNPEAAFLCNASGAELIAQGCCDIDAFLVHISTDYVFDGTKTTAYKVTDKPNPLSVYGASKLLGEQLIIKTFQNHCIVRISGLYGQGGQNFASTIYSLLMRNEIVTAVSDNKMLTSYAPDIACYLSELISQKATGIFHMTNSGVPSSWYEFAQFAASVIGPSVCAKLIRVNSDELKRIAIRPQNSVLHNSELRLLRDWHEALTEYIETNTNL